MDHFETATDRVGMVTDMRAARIAESRRNIEIIDARLVEVDELEARGVPDDLRPKLDEVRVKLIECRAGFVQLEEFDRDHHV